MPNKYIYTDGRNTKSVDVIRDSFDFVEAMKESKDGDLYAKVAAVFRAMNLTADTLANMSFAITKNGEDFDTSADWQNKVGFMPKPQELLRLWRMSLFMYNIAYGRMISTKQYKGRAVAQELVYVVPSTMKIATDENSGTIQYIQREVNGIAKERYTFPNDKSLVRFWRMDHTTELLPSDNSEFVALTQAAGILYSADWWTQNYFSRGAIRPTVLAVKGMVLGDKKDDLQSSWAKFMRGLGRSWSELSKIINAETMDVKQIGDGLGDIKNSPVYRQAIENVAIASGMPLSLLLANSANYATAQTEYAGWFRDTITPWANWMAEAMNEQLFRPLGLKFEFRPEASEPAQEEEVKRAQAFQTYANALAGHPQALSLAAQIVGIDLPVGVEYTDLDKVIEPPAPVVDPLQQDPAIPDMTAKAWEELDNWKTKAVRYAKRGKPVTFEFKTEHVTDSIAELVRTRLLYAATPDEVKSAFDVDANFEKRVGFSVTNNLYKESDSEIKMLADALNRAADAPEKRDDMLSIKADNVTINNDEAVKAMTAMTKAFEEMKAASQQIVVNVPEQAAPTVTVNVPEQSAPIVNVTNAVNPTPVTVENKVTVPPIKFPEPAREATITTNGRGEKIIKVKQ